MATEPITGLTYQEAGSLQTDVLQNEELNYFGAWLNCVVLTIGDASPPISPENGDRHIVGAGTGDWAMHDNDLAVYRDGWQFYVPSIGAGVHNLDDDKDYVFSGSGPDWIVKTIPSSAAAEDVTYDNSTSGLSATDVQAAIDEIAAANGVSIITESTTSRTIATTDAGRDKYIRCTNDSATTLTFDDAESYTAGMVFNIRAVGAAGVTLAEDGVTLTPPADGTLVMAQYMAVTVIMTSSTAGDVIGQTVAA